MNDDGLMAGPLDIDGPRRQVPVYPAIEARRGVMLQHRDTGRVGVIIDFSPPRLTLRDSDGRDHVLRYAAGAVRANVDGKTVAVSLRQPAPSSIPPSITASGSVGHGAVPARIARASRIWVEGVHDAELVEKIWGDDLRAEGVVVQPLDGADDLAEKVRAFRPGPSRRLGVLLDHLIDGTKETRIAADASDPNVLITGHPFVDIWQAVKPSVIGADAWPVIPMGRPWKQGVLDALGFSGTTAQFWKMLLGRVESWTDLEPRLLGAVEELIDFVAPPER